MSEYNAGLFIVAVLMFFAGFFLGTMDIHQPRRQTLIDCGAARFDAKTGLLIVKPLRLEGEK